jgi:hypothetical protein
MSKLVKPSSNDVIVYDGKEWYVTTKEDILKEANDLLSECRTELANEKEANRRFREQVSQDMSELTGMVRSLLSLKGE